MMKRVLIPAAAVAALSGCATSPDKVQPSYVDPMQYRDYECSQLARSMSHRSQRIANMHAQMSDEASDDAVAVGVSAVLFWPAAFFASGGNEAQVSEYKRLLGEYEALEEQSVLKDCDIAVASPEERIAAASETASEPSSR